MRRSPIVLTLTRQCLIKTHKRLFGDTTIQPKRLDTVLGFSANELL
jgi:hypothetical protein